MHLIWKLTTIAMAAFVVTSDCLDKDILTDLGCDPLANPEALSAPGYCKKVNGTAKACCSQGTLAAQLKYVQTHRNKNEGPKIDTLRNTIEELVRKFNKLVTKVAGEKVFNEKKITETARAAIEEAKAFMPEKGGDLADAVKEARNTCLVAQNKASVGTFCILSSDIASNFVNVNFAQTTTPAPKIVGENTTTPQTRLLAANSDYSLNVRAQQSAADHIVEACFPIIKAACAYRHVGRVIDELKHYEARDRDGCFKELVACEANVAGCSPKVKALIVEKLFSPFNNSLIDEAQLEDVDDFLTDNFGSVWDKTKEAADDVRDAAVSAAKKIKDKLTKKKADTTAPATATNNATATVDAKAKRLLEETVKVDVKADDGDDDLDLDLVEEDDESEEDAKAVIADDKDTAYPAASYSINSTGADMIAEADYSGVAISSSSILATFIGLLFVSIQIVF